MSAHGQPQQASTNGSRRILVVLISAVGLASLALIVSRWSGAEDLTTARETIALPVEVIEIQPVEKIKTKRYFTGRVEAGRESELAFSRPERIASILAREGDRVRRGQALARLDSRALEVRLRQAQAERRRAQAILAERESGPRPERIAAARARALELERRLELSRLQANRRRELLERQAISREEMDRVKYESQALEASLASANAELEELRNGTRAEHLEEQRAVFASLDAQVAAIQLELDKSLLKAPYAGRLSERLAEVGDFVQPGAPVFRILGDDRREVRIGVSPEQASLLDPGSLHTISAGESRWVGRLLAVLPDLDAATRSASRAVRAPRRSDGSGLPGTGCAARARSRRGSGGLLASARGSCPEPPRAVVLPRPRRSR